ncbi:PhnD/SsuA/transferrin family substrate-binding protein [Hyalangium sp.]|uniref:PhnD/SsuA/transferrin family substrate-binding protein n=1 Tax=Hyalangium sp. TaxID=2028555 RepID=UPI002D352A92|nr:PhnD/SsuA/transferrin family substrate-binding protein [Hyalangium sp.]HYH98812.1 PhnD/SsuA/transferrin family substrate-binding protein [Hyalangium sp.]
MSLLSAPIRFLIYPSLGEVREHVRIEFFGRLLSQRAGRPIVVELARTYEMVAQELAAGRVDMAWATAEQCNAFEPQAHAVLRAVRSGRWHYHAALISRLENPLSLETLKGARAAWVAPLSTGGYLLARRHLEARGLAPDELFAEQQFHGSYRNALLAVLQGQADVASLFTTHPDEVSVRAGLAQRVGASEHLLTPFAFTEPTLSDGIILTRRLSEADAAAMIAALTAMSHDGRGMQPLLGLFEIDGFALAPDSKAWRPPAPPHQRAEYLAVELDAEERYQSMCSSAGLVFGRDVHGREGSTLMQVLPPDAGASLEALARAARHHGIGGRAEYRLEVNGQTRLYAAEATPQPAPPGQPAPGTALLVRDITEQHELETELYRLASFPLLHPEPMLELGQDGTLHYANPAAHTAFPDLLMLGMRHPLVEAALASLQQGQAQGGVPVVEISHQHWELVISSLQEAGVIRVFAKNVTTRKLMEARLLHADRMAALGTLASRVGHEMNNPLAYLMANLSFAREEITRLRQAIRSGKSEGVLDEFDEVLEALGESREGADRLRLIVENLHLLVREPLAHRAWVDVQHVLEDGLSVVSNDLRHRARLEKDFQPVPLVEADEARLGQVFLNLMLNAVQAMSDREAARNVLRVATRTSPAGEIIVEIKDTGEGMKPEVMMRLFEPFFTTRPGSTGMGMPVSHAIVTSLGGTLRVESEPGVGTRVTVTLPVQ